MSKQNDVIMATGAAGISLLPAVSAAVFPALRSVPLCTGVCGSCGGGCLGGVGALVWIACCAYRNRKRKEACK